MINPPQLFRSRTARYLLIVAVVALAIGSGIAIAAALRGDSTAPSADLSGPVTKKSLDTAVLGLCRVRTALGKNEMDAARTAFYDDSHLFLHQLAAAVEDKDRDLATTLLVAKYRVEDLLPASGQPQTPTATDNTPPTELVTQLLQQVDQSATVVGLSAPDCQ